MNSNSTADRISGGPFCSFGVRMKVKIKPVAKYEIETEDGQQLGTFSVSGDEWEGLVALTSMSGEKLIVERESWIDRIFPAITGESSRVANVVKATAKVMELLEQSEQSKRGAAPVTKSAITGRRK